MHGDWKGSGLCTNLNSLEWNNIHWAAIHQNSCVTGFPLGSLMDQHGTMGKSHGRYYFGKMGKIDTLAILENVMD